MNWNYWIGRLRKINGDTFAKYMNICYIAVIKQLIVTLKSTVRPLVFNFEKTEVVILTVTRACRLLVR